MKADDAIIAQMDATVDGLQLDASAADELFAVVDLLDGSVLLRRSLSDASASEKARVQLAERIFTDQVSPAVLQVLKSYAAAEFSTGAAFGAALEAQAVRQALLSAQAAGQLEQVTGELFSVQSVVEDTPELAVSLRSPSYAATSKRELLDRLFAGKVSSTTLQLTHRAVRPAGAAFLPTIKGYLALTERLANLTIATVTVARPLDAERTARLKQALEKTAGKPLSLQIHVDPAVIGGVHVAIGDDVIESTVAARLEAARRQLVNL